MKIQSEKGKGENGSIPDPVHPITWSHLWALKRKKNESESPKKR